MSIDVINPLLFDTGVLQSHLDAGDGTSTFRVNVRNSVGVSGRPIANELTVDRRTASFRMFELLKDEHSGALSKNESISLLIERT